MIRENLLSYGASYLNYGYEFSKIERVFSFNLFPFQLNGIVYDVTHDPIRFDLSKFAFNFTSMAVDNKPVVFVVLPLIEHFKASFNYKYKCGLIKGDGRMDLELNNTSALATLSLGATDKGHFYP